jgi:SagB-type dehydrogenase family enzyme
MRARHVVADDRRIIQKLAQSSLKAGAHARNSLDTKSSLSEVFHENTKLGPLTLKAHLIWSGNYVRARRDRERLKGGKVYTLMEQRTLPSVQPETALEQTIAARRSTRTFSGEVLRLDELARLLRFSYGNTDSVRRLRAVASGGALYPLELYVIALAVEGLDQGIYHYSPDTSHLDVVRIGNCREPLPDLVYLVGIDVDHAAALVVVTAAFRRSTIKYLDRGYRMILFEAGEAAQNLSLLATSMDLGACLLGGFQDDRLSDFLEIDGVEEAPLLVMALGRPAPPTAEAAAAPPVKASA